MSPRLCVRWQALYPIKLCNSKCKKNFIVSSFILGRNFAWPLIHGSFWEMGHFYSCNDKYIHVR
jgi:hypothetical protein